MIPDPNREMAGLFLRSKEILQDHCKLYTTSKAKLKDLIQKVLHHPDFDRDPDQVAHDMHERLMQAIEEEDISIWDKREEGDGRNDCSFYQRPLTRKKVLEELLSDRLLEGHQHSGFKFDLRQNMIRRVIRFSAVMPMVLCHSNWPSCELDVTRYQFQLCCTLTRPS